jgi:hypothetical protein
MKKVREPVSYIMKSVYSHGKLWRGEHQFISQREKSSLLFIKLWFILCTLTSHDLLMECVDLLFLQHILTNVYSVPSKLEARTFHD